MNILLFEMKIYWLFDKHVSKLPSYYSIYKYGLLGKAVVVKSPLPSMIGQQGFLGTHPSQVEA
jgi:hypothetical protein